ncbi:MAG TPA: DUF4350 domain-containing protein [Nocardioides sp.]|uniref:DUF4350 domain-containing protein n=1 Tax=Nocardioides sp. TaxID=35761 RepID=UPI002BA8BD6A|nr:DUF4350 domain-containing protein [Nocardioides sp.]HTW13601.1 DUF4350 domain-containing protein [Nocardioides sp.]
MSAPTVVNAPASSDVPAASGWRRHRSTVLLLAVVVLAVAVVALVLGRARTSDPLDPANPGPQGAQAVARVLADEGVDVTVVRGADELEDTAVDAGTTVLVARPDLLGDSTVERLLDHASAAARLVVAGASPGAAEALGVAAPSTVDLGEGRDASCADPLVEDLRIEIDLALAYPLDGCFDGPGGAVLVDGPGDLVLLGADQALTNDQVLRADNAALALRLLGQEDRLVWYVPSLTDLTGDDGVSAGALVPRWIGPALFLLTLVVGSLMLWRGRRLGRLAVEPLPVVVTAAETVRSQGRLYRHGGDRAHAARTLRAATRTRLCERLALGAAVPPDELVRAVALHSDRPAPELYALLSPDAAAPARDTDLIALATTLAALEEEVSLR